MKILKFMLQIKKSNDIFDVQDIKQSSLVCSNVGTTEPRDRLSILHFLDSGRPDTTTYSLE